MKLTNEMRGNLKKWLRWRAEQPFHWSKTFPESGRKCTASGWGDRDRPGCGYGIFPDGSRNLTYGYLGCPYLLHAGYGCDAV